MSTKKIGFRPLKIENNKRNYLLDFQLWFSSLDALKMK